MRRVRYGQILPAILVAALGVPACYSPQSVDWQSTGSAQGAPSTTNELQPKPPGTPARNPPADEAPPPPEVASAPTLSALRAACDGLPYEASLSATGPAGPYALTLLDDAGDLTLGADGVLSGIPRGAGTRALVVSITDANAKKYESSVELRVRERCWVAYSSRETGALRLHVTDVLATTSKVFPAASSEQAFDFAFSPSGRHLAFRAGIDADRAALYVLRPESDVAARLPFELSVAAYAWSSSGEHLAVILAAGGDQWFISGLAVPADSSAAALAEAVPWPLVPTSYRRELHWMGDTATVHLGRLSSDPPEEPRPIEVPYLSRRESSGLSTSREYSALLLPAGDGALYPTPDGYIPLLSQPAPDVAVFEAYFPLEASALAQDGLTVHESSSVPPDVWWSNDRAHAGRLDADGHMLFFSMRDGATPRAVSRNRCGRVLAWRTLPDRERVICVDEEACPLDPERPLLRVLDFSPASNDLNERALDGCRETRVASDEPRDLSASGNWLVFDDGAATSVLAVAGPGSPRTTIVAGSQFPHQRAYAISPDETTLLWQSGSTLWWSSPLGSGKTDELTRGRDASSHQVSLQLSERDRCDPRFLGSPERWCGRGELDPRARWSTDSLSVVFQTSDGALWSADVSRRDVPAVLRRLSTEGAVCTNGCIDGFALQP